MAFVCTVIVVAMHSPGARRIFNLEFLGSGAVLIAVPYFFLASGFFLAGHIFNENNWYFFELKKRIKSLVIPFFLWNGLWITAMFAITLMLNLIHSRELLDNCNTILINGITMGHPDKPPPFCGGVIYDAFAAMGLNPFSLPFVQQLWYVRALILLVVISPLLKRFANPTGLILLFIIYLVLRPFGSNEGYNLSKLLGFARYNGFFRIMLSAEGMFYFTAGMYLRKHFIRFSRKQWFFIGMVAVALLAAFDYCNMHHILVNGLYFRCLSIPFVLAIVWHIVPDSQWPKWLVASAFPVFLMHRCTLYFIRIVNVPRIWPLQVIIVVVLSVATTFLLRKFFPRIASILFGGR